MEILRLDPADPLASVLAWLAALARAAGLDLARPSSAVQLNRASAATVRTWLADWSRQLRLIIHAPAARLAASLRFTLRRPAAAAPVRPGVARSSEQPGCGPIGRLVVVASLATRRPSRSVVAPSASRRSPAELLDPVEQAALKRRTRAVLMALRDPDAAIRRLARRLAHRLAGAGRVERRSRRRFPGPPRALTLARSGRAPAPELHPPNGRVRAPA